MSKRTLAAITAGVFVASMLHSPQVHAEVSAEEEAPLGHHWEERPRKGMVLAGVLTFSGSYLLPPLLLGVAGVAGSLVCDKSHCDGGPNVGKLFIPIAGPILYSEDHKSESPFWWYLFAAGQVAGIAMTTYGLVSPQKVAVRNSGWMSATPVVSPGGGGVAAFGAF